MNIEELLEHVDNDIIIDIMEENGSPIYSRGVTSSGQPYMTFKTICHNGDSSKLYFYEDTKTFYCYTNCGAMSLFDLIMKIQGFTEFSQAVNYIANKLGIKTTNNRIGIQDSFSVKVMRQNLSEMDKKIELRNNKSIIQNINKYYDKNILNYFDNNTFYQGWIDEGISEDSMRKFKISFYWLEGHIIIPHYNGEGELVGIRRRSLNLEDSKNKYMPEYLQGTFFEHPLGLNFYGLYQNKEAIRKKKQAIIVEGEKSVLLSDTYYGNNSIALATCGFNISDWQIKTLKQLGVNTVYLGFDKDYDVTKEQEYKEDKIIWENYQHYKTRLIVLAKRLSMFFTTYIIFDKHELLNIKDSPMDRGKAVLEQLIKEAKLIKDNYGE